MDDLREETRFIRIDVIACIFENSCYLSYVVLLGRAVSCHRLSWINICSKE